MDSKLNAPAATPQTGFRDEPPASLTATIGKNPGKREPEPPGKIPSLERARTRARLDGKHDRKVFDEVSVHLQVPGIARLVGEYQSPLDGPDSACLRLSHLPDEFIRKVVTGQIARWDEKRSSVAARLLVDTDGSGLRVKAVNVRSMELTDGVRLDLHVDGREAFAAGIAAQDQIGEDGSLRFRFDLGRQAPNIDYVDLSGDGTTYVPSGR